jgi:hypothetical protein
MAGKIMLKLSRHDEKTLTMLSPMRKGTWEFIGSTWAPPSGGSKGSRWGKGRHLGLFEDAVEMLHACPGIIKTNSIFPKILTFCGLKRRSFRNSLFSPV